MACRFVHNVAEGIVVAVPVYAGTGDRRLALVLTALSVRAAGQLMLCSPPPYHTTTSSHMHPPQLPVVRPCPQGLSEPVGALVGVVLATSWFGGMLEAAVNAALAGVAGVMVAVSFLELLPQAHRLAPGAAGLAAWFAAGCAFIGATTLLL